MAQVVEGASKFRGLLESIGSGGKLSRSQWEKQQSENELYRVHVQRATQQLAQDAAAEQRAQEDQQFERAQQEALGRSREQSIKLQGQQLQKGDLELQDMQSASSADPFTVALSDPNLGPGPKAQLARDQGIYAHMHGTTYAKRFATESLMSAKKLQEQHQSDQMRSHIQDQLALGAYGEDESGQQGAASLTQLLDSGATAEEVARKDMELRMSMARGADKKLEQQQALAYAESVLGSIQPGTPGAEKARRAFVAAQHGIIPPHQLYSELEVAQRPETQTGQPKQLSKVEIRTKAHDMAVKEAHALKVTDHAQFEQLMQKNMALLIQDQSENSGDASTQQGPASGAPSGSLPSGTPGGAPAPSQPVDQATAIRAAQEAVKHGATDDELRKILEAAGIDPDAPAATAPFKDSGSSVTDKPLSAADVDKVRPRRNAPKSEAYKKPRKP